ncbi:hypothetical protein CF392_01890 [Tamilnaduibacter salinus]|uniref:DUF2804 domain-containing protein n=1 Tax=Tamilnaduibacter salinus TaxID=1484056 RepID=A0A2A2I6E3_9GAMM|nr:DUF2804 domain-containing protein [Tamilnaduibacter salinus]PAV27227.1 hypothetical protein CF392_01890 [Tamilnaduibacter salinus]
MKLIDERGQPRLGRLVAPVDELNYRDYDLRTPMDRPRSRLARRWRFNQFQFVSAMGPDWLLGLAIVDLKLVSTAFCYTFDFRSGELSERSWMRPLPGGTRSDPFPEAGTTAFRRGDSTLTIQGQGTAREVRVDAPDLALDLRLMADEAPLRVCSQAGYTGWVYTRKSAGLPVSGRLRWGGRERVLDAAMRGSIDWSAGFMRRETAWNWACLAGETADGQSLGLNLAAGVNETGVTENALWLGGRCLPLGPAIFRFRRYDTSVPWRITTDDGRVDLVFEPAGVRRERLNLGLLASNFRQFPGTFRGTVRDEQGRVLSIIDQRGLMEDHFARW